MSMKANILVVEDEGLIRKDIVNYLTKLKYNVVGETDNGPKAIDMALELKPDVIMFDIHLKGDMTGIEAAKKIREELDVVVIYITGYSDDTTLESAKGSEPDGYVLKPLKEFDLKAAIELALDKHSKQQVTKAELALLRSLTSFKSSAEFLFVKHTGKFIRLQSDEVYYVEALKDYVQVHTLLQRYTIHATMKDVERKLAKTKFQRVHRSYIVNMDKVAAIQGTDITIEGLNRTIPIGNLYKDEFSERINVL
ncbi:MAG: LytR/AlgR family response regulator transcription factor [Flavobacteriales bacterium]